MFICVMLINRGSTLQRGNSNASMVLCFDQWPFECNKDKSYVWVQ